MLEVIWNIPLGTGSVKIRKTDRYLKNSEVCELQRRDGRHGALRSQLNFTPEGHIHIRWGAAVHRRLAWGVNVFTTLWGGVCCSAPQGHIHLTGGLGWTRGSDQQLD